jgi:hypothetical protein
MKFTEIVHNHISQNISQFQPAFIDQILKYYPIYNDVVFSSPHLPLKTRNGPYAGCSRLNRLKSQIITDLFEICHVHIYYNM